MTSDKIQSTWKARLTFAARLVGVLFLSTFLVLSDEQKSAIASVLRDPMSVLAARSPGGRQTASLRQTKLKRQAALSEGLLENANVLAPEALAADPDVFAEHAQMPADEEPALAAVGAPGSGKVDLVEPPLSLAHGGGGGLPGAGPGGAFIGGGGGGFIGGGGGGGAICDKDEKCGSPTGTPTPPPAIVAVPEPSTWLMIIIGFFSLGGVLRAIELSHRSITTRRPHAD